MDRFIKRNGHDFGFYGHLGGSGDNPWFPLLTDSIAVVYLFHMPLFFLSEWFDFACQKTV